MPTFLEHRAHRGGEGRVAERTNRDPDPSRMPGRPGVKRCSADRAETGGEGRSAVGDAGVFARLADDGDGGSVIIDDHPEGRSAAFLAGNAVAGDGAAALIWDNGPELAALAGGFHCATVAALPPKAKARPLG